MKRTLLSALLVFSALSPSYSHAQALTQGRLRASKIKTVACPQFIMNLRSGLTTSILKNATFCFPDTSILKDKRFSKRFSTGKLVIDGSYTVGTPFLPVVSQEGDVQTDPFDVHHYPAIVSYSVQSTDSKSSFRISVFDAQTGKEINSIVRHTGSVQGRVAVASKGRFYLKFQAFGGIKESDQPVYSASMEYMPPYVGSQISRADLTQAGVKVASCPKLMIDRVSGRSYRIGNNSVCSRNSFEEIEFAGLTAAPLNLATEMFVTMDPSFALIGDGGWLPFRILKPTAIVYAVDDPSPGRGKLDATLNEFGRSASSKFVNITGSIGGTSTFINIPGDYFISVRTSPNRAAEFGEISSDWSIEGSS